MYIYYIHKYNHFKYLLYLNNLYTIEALHLHKYIKYILHICKEYNILL